ncbi:MAG: phosphoglycerate dehydrogenase [Bdellovibrionales bacterium]|nr:phosphoglycerate dehydrogenase [Bdellovibrionales bacterium]
MKCILLEGIHKIAGEQLMAQNLQVDHIKSAPGTKELSLKKNCLALGIRSRTRITKNILEALCPSLRLIGAFCIGTDQIDLNAARQMGVPVFNAPYGNTRSVAELVISHIIALSRQSYHFNQIMHQRKWNKTAQGSKEVRGKTLGIVGYGHIGTQVSILAESMGMKVIYFDIIETLQMGNARPVKNLKELMSLSDFVTLHVPQTSATKNMIQEKQLRWMKKGSFLINTSRGTVVNLEDLKISLQEGHLAGAALDVFPEEPQAKESTFICPLQGMKQVILTPHIAGSTEEAQENIAKQVSASLLKYLFHGISEGAVNFPILNPPILDPTKKGQRLVNIHKNVPGVLGNINGLMSRLKINIQSQYLSTKEDIGYLIMDMEHKNIKPLWDAIDSLDTSIRTYILPFSTDRS